LGVVGVATPPPTPEPEPASRFFGLRRPASLEMPNPQG